MSLTYTSTALAVGGGVFGLSSFLTTELWGMTFVEDRYALLLVKASDGNVYWKKIDTYQLNVVSSDLPFAPSAIGVAAANHTKPGQFLHVEGANFYYHNGTNVLVRSFADSSVVGQFTPRTAAAGALVEADIDAMIVKGTKLYIASKSKNKIFYYNLAAITLSANPVVNATSEVTVSELGTDAICGLFAQTGADTDIVLLIKGAAKRAIKFTGALVRKGVTDWTDPSANIHAAQFKGSILYVASNDPAQAGTGVSIYRFGDAATNVVDKNATTITISKDRVKAGSNDVVTLAFSAKDGYGQTFPVTEKVRFTLVKIGDAFDKNDGGLALIQNGPYRDSLGNPISTQLDVNFDAQGQAVVYWQAPMEVPIDSLLHRIKIKYPIYD